MHFNLPHRRLNPLTREWVLVSPQRATRPWLGQVEKIPPEHLPAYDAACYLCPGNARAGGVRNPVYESTFVFDNDFAALVPEAPAAALGGAPLFQAEPTPGRCRVVCFSPRHDLTLPELSQAQVEAVVQTWTEQSAELGSLDYVKSVVVFENKGALMGCSNPHPHSQIWASGHVPDEPGKELVSQSAYYAEYGRPLLLDYVEAEQQRAERVILSNDHFTALVPYWAVWPFETLVIAHRPARSLPELTPAETAALADVLRRLTSRYDNMFEIAFPYSMGFHQAPVGAGPEAGWVLHAHFYPPLLRSATVKKFMVGYEMLGMPQRDITPEQAADRLRGLSDVHYKRAPAMEERL